MSKTTCPVCSILLKEGQVEIHKAATGHNFDTPKTFQEIFNGIFWEAQELLVQKQRSYGPKNIESLGFFGVFDRLSSDKIERLRNAMNGKVVKGRVQLDFTETLADESVEDTLLDMMNYAAILLCLKRGQWGAPLEEERR